MEQGLETATRRWTTPQCPFEIEYSLRVLDDIRLTVVDAFFSLPRGGAEIGGLLLGYFDGKLLTINGFQPVDCEHATGPSFILSPRDQTLLAEMTAKAKRNDPSTQPVGWYHSHTRSEIFLSDLDQEIHNRFFPEAWQVALVLKPHTFQPTRAGFFFREAGGKIHGSATYQEFVLDPMPLKPQSNGPVVLPRPGRDLTNRGESNPPAPEKKQVPITREVTVDTSSVAAPPETRPVEHATLEFAALADDRSWPMVKISVTLAILFVLVGAGYQTREMWYPGVLTKIRPMLPQDTENNISLNLRDDAGQLNIQWDRNSAAVQKAERATLVISDGAAKSREITLDQQHLLTGSFRYARESERVDVSLTVLSASGAMVREQASFLGSLPASKDDPKLRQERDALTEKTDKLQKDLNFQTSKTRKLEKDLKDMQDQMEQKRRLEGSSSDPAKK